MTCKATKFGDTTRVPRGIRGVTHRFIVSRWWKHVKQVDKSCGHMHIRYPNVVGKQGDMQLNLGATQRRQKR
jgi:hypothetical protein